MLRHICPYFLRFYTVTSSGIRRLRRPRERLFKMIISLFRRRTVPSVVCKLLLALNRVTKCCSAALTLRVAFIHLKRICVWRDVSLAGVSVVIPTGSRGPGCYDVDYMDFLTHCGRKPIEIWVQRPSNSLKKLAILFASSLWIDNPPFSVV